MGFDTPNQGDDVLSSSDVDHQQTTNRTHDGDSITPSSLDTEQGDITGESYVSGSRSTTKSGISSGTWTNILDTENDDNLNELDSNFQFSPSETTHYTVIGLANASMSDGDSISLRLRNVTDGSTVSRLAEESAGNVGSVKISGAWEGVLDSNKSYSLQAVNFASSFELRDGSFGRFINNPIHP